VIRSKETGIAGRLLRPVRVRCKQCHRTFVVLAERTHAASARGLPDSFLPTGAEERGQQMIRELAAKRTQSLRKRAKAVCPHCYFAHPYEGPVDRASSVIGSALAFALIGVIPGSVLGFFLDLLGAGAAVGAGLGAMLGGVDGARADLTPRPEPEEKRNDRRAMTDDEWREFRAECERNVLEPSLIWWYMRLGRQHPEAEVLVPLDFEDITGAEWASQTSAPEETPRESMPSAEPDAGGRQDGEDGAPP
jgi:hypothetical protein